MRFAGPAIENTNLTNSDWADRGTKNRTLSGMHTSRSIQYIIINVRRIITNNPCSEISVGHSFWLPYLDHYMGLLLQQNFASTSPQTGYDPRTHEGHRNNTLCKSNDWSEIDKISLEKKLSSFSECKCGQTRAFFSRCLRDILIAQ